MSAAYLPSSWERRRVRKYKRALLVPNEPASKWPTLAVLIVAVLAAVVGAL